jgi:hypothetical protein
MLIPKFQIDRPSLRTALGRQYFGTQIFVEAVVATLKLFLQVFCEESVEKELPSP